MKDTQQPAIDAVPRAVAAAIAHLEAGEDEEAEQLARCLVCATGGDVSALVEAFVEREMYYPAVLFARADDAARRALVRRAGHPSVSELSRHHLLGALAWIEHPEVVDLFASWRRAPPAWRAQLDAPPHEYTLDGGWELTPAGGRRDLFHRTCHELVKAGGGGPSPVAVATPLRDACGWCGHPLIALLELDTASPACAFLGLPVPRARIATCARCGMYGTVLGHLTGSPAWHAGNVKPEHLPDPDEEWGELSADMVLAPAPSSPLRAADQFLPVKASQLGGHPTWCRVSNSSRISSRSRVPGVERL